MRRSVVQFVVGTVVLSAACACPARASNGPLVGFNDSEAIAANGPIPGADGIPETTPADVCGSNDATFLTELLDTPLDQVKVLEHWADIIPGKEMMASGIVHDVSVAGIDLPFDHPFSSDLNFDVELDPPYAELAKRLGSGADPDVGEEGWLHVELEIGQLPHDPDQVVHGPTAGEPWDILPEDPPQNTLNGDAYVGLQSEYIPQEGDRIAVMGRWILDCGHDDFHSELHPLTFMAFGHAEGEKTVVHVLANPYRVTQQYTSNLNGIGANQVSNTARSGKPLPPFFVDEVTRLILGRDHLQAPVLLEATRPSPAEWKVCTPPDTSGRFLQIVSSFVKRPHARVHVVRDGRRGSHCVRVLTYVQRGYRAEDPPLRQCDLPWDWLNERAAEEAGLGAGFDLRLYIKDAIDQAATGTLPPDEIDAAKARVDNTPTSVCYDSLAAPLPADPPSTIRRNWRRARTNREQPFPFYGKIELSWHE